MRRSEMRKLAWILFMLVLPCFSQTNENEQTFGGLNGRFWERLKPSDRLWFIIGVHEGLNITGISEAATMRLYFPDIPYGDILKGVDRFYAEPENLRFPVVYALKIFALKVNGATQSEIDKDLAEHRQAIKDVEKAIKKKQEDK
jgi:hypothetical protein